MKTRRKLAKIFILIAILGFITYTVCFMINGMNELSKNPGRSLKEAPKDYMQLFKPSKKGKIKLMSASTAKYSNIFAFFNYDDKYDIELYKINIGPHFSLSKDVEESNNESNGSYPNTYMRYNEGNFRTTYNIKITEITRKLYLSLQGDSISKIIKNDSIVCYYLRLKNASIQYKVNGMYEIYMRPTSTFSFSTKPVSLMFIKRNSSLYFFLMTPKDDGIDMDANLLLDITQNNT